MPTIRYFFLQKNYSKTAALKEALKEVVILRQIPIKCETENLMRPDGSLRLVCRLNFFFLHLNSFSNNLISVHVQIVEHQKTTYNNVTSKKNISQKER